MGHMKGDIGDYISINKTLVELIGNSAMQLST